MVKPKKSKATVVVISIIAVVAVVASVLGYLLNAHTAWIGEQASTSNYVHKTVGLLTDMPHFSGELVYSLLENIVTFAILWTLGKNRLHKQIDAEHGYEHDERGGVHKLTNGSEVE